jgi:hypothetical protein
MYINNKTRSKRKGTESTISWKWTETPALSKFWWLEELWISSETLFKRICKHKFTIKQLQQLNKFQSINYFLEHSRKHTCFARLPNTNNIASITLLFPLPFGPTTAEKLWNQKFNRISSSQVKLKKLKQLNEKKKDESNLMKGANALFTRIRLEVLHNHLFDEESRACCWFASWVGLRFHWRGTS